VTFASTSTGGTSPYTYSWRFGDGTSATTSGPTHSYGSTGTYTVNAWINDSGGGTYHTTIAIKVATAGGTGLSSTVGGLPLWLWIVLAALIAAVVVVALIVMSRRSKRAPPASNPPPPPYWQGGPTPSGAPPPPPPSGGPPPGVG
jgi:PKD repeat protein